MITCICWLNLYTFFRRLLYIYIYVCVCVCVCVCVSVLPLNLHFCRHVNNHRQIDDSCQNISYLDLYL